MPNTTGLLRMASTYFFWPSVLGRIERPRVVRTASPKTWEGRALPSSSAGMMWIERRMVSAVRASPRSSRVMSSSKSRATRSASACSPVMVISLPRTKTVLSKAASISFSSSSRVPRRLTIEWLPGTSTLTWTCVGCRTLAVGPSVRGHRWRQTGDGRRIPSIASRGSPGREARVSCQGGRIGSGVGGRSTDRGDGVQLDWGRVLVGQLEFYWDVHLRPRLEGLGDEEYFWEPVEGCWSLRRAADRRWRLHRRPEPSPPPVTTIAWRLVHIGATCRANRASPFFGDGRVPADADMFAPRHVPADLPGDAEAAVAFLERSYRH